MDRILTLLLLLLIALASAAPAEAGAGHAQPGFHAGEAHTALHFHPAVPEPEAGAGAPAAECSVLGGHCAAALTAPVREVFGIGFSVVARSAICGPVSGQGIVLTADPPPPRT